MCVVKYLALVNLSFVMWTVMLLHFQGLYSMFTNRTNVLPQDLAKSRGHEIRIYTFPIVLKFDGHLGSNAAEMFVKF